MTMAETTAGRGTLGDQEKAGSFFADEERILNDLAGGSAFSFRRGDKWAINPETGEAIYDPKFFEDKGYTPSQALFGAFHEIKCHLVELTDLLDRRGGREAYDRLKERTRTKKRLHLWDNCREDIKGNLAIIEFAPSLAQDVTALYREKLWPESDFTNRPRHLQFMYGVLRQAMVPDEEVIVDPQVQEAIAKLRNMQGKDTIALATHPHQDPLLALLLSERYIEPVIDELYQIDLEERWKEGEGNSEDVFNDYYQDYEERHQEPLEIDNNTLKKINNKHSASARQAAGYENEHGVSKKNVTDYYNEYRVIEPYIEPLRAIFRRIVEQRRIPLRRLVPLKEEGVMIDPGLIVQTYLDIEAGIENSRTMKDFEGRFIDENIPGNFKVRLVADQSGSMGDGIKDVAQRRSAILIMEALKEFSDMLDAERARLSVDLDVQTELRSFGTTSRRGTKLYKPLSKELSEKQRIEFFKGLDITVGGTNDFDALAEIEKDIKEQIARNPQYGTDLKGGRLREILIVLSDGDSNDIPEAQQRIQNLRNLGVKVVGLGMTEEANGILTTYAPEARICYNVSDLPKTLQEMLAEYLANLSITGNPQDLQIEEGAI